LVLEEKNSFLEGETKELKRLVGTMRSQLDHVNSELGKTAYFQNQLPNQYYNTSLPYADETITKNKRPARLLPLQLLR